MKKLELKSGDVIRWRYWHSLGSKSGLWRDKDGVFIGLVKHTYRYNGRQLAVVYLRGNKHVSRVPYHNLRVLITKEQLKQS